MSSEEGFSCEYCSKKFTRLHTMKRHQSTVSHCIDIQNGLGKVVKQIEYFCTYESCRKKLSSPSAFHYHIQHCKMNKDSVKGKQLLEHSLMKAQLDELKKEIKAIKESASLPSTINNTTNNNTINTTNNTNTTNNNITIQNWMTEERVIGIFKKYLTGVDDLSPKSLATLTANHLVNGKDKPLYWCTDPSRQRMVYVDSDGNKQVDESCKLLIEHVLKAKPFVNQVVQKHIIYEPQEEIDRVKPLHETFFNLHQNRNYKIELSRQLPRSSESARKLHVPDMDTTNGVDWYINDTVKDTEESLSEKTMVHQQAGDFFSQEDED